MIIEPAVAPFTINYAAILVASVVQFVIGAIWYTPVFGKVWGKIHGFDKVSPAEQKMMMKEMPPFLVVQLLSTIVTTFVFALLASEFPSSWDIYVLAGLFWLGFVVPTQVGAVVFGGTPTKWMLTKIGIMAGGSFLCLQTAAAVLKMMQ